ncbi:9013_t:CDS:2 [Ambispora gerdemannii]|uniref:9013_t:CDS:1 n=1 Tax=Ambispora gerdemannii TaxID=144530 RepID=A0A9N8W662_9GLOM|nr:9013_t:CDS:2 [Ambispora gerdemannii]
MSLPKEPTTITYRLEKFSRWPSPYRSVDSNNTTTISINHSSSSINANNDQTALPWFHYCQPNIMLKLENMYPPNVLGGGGEPIFTVYDDRGSILEQFNASYKYAATTKAKMGLRSPIIGIKYSETEVDGIGRTTEKIIKIQIRFRNAEDYELCSSIFGRYITKKDALTTTAATAGSSISAAGAQNSNEIQMSAHGNNTINNSYSQAFSSSGSSSAINQSIQHQEFLQQQQMPFMPSRAQPTRAPLICVPSYELAKHTNHNINNQFNNSRESSISGNHHQNIQLSLSKQQNTVSFVSNNNDNNLSNNKTNSIQSSNQSNILQQQYQDRGSNGTQFDPAFNPQLQPQQNYQLSSSQSFPQQQQSTPSNNNNNFYQPQNQNTYPTRQQRSIASDVSPDVSIVNNQNDNNNNHRQESSGNNSNTIESQQKTVEVVSLLSPSPAVASIKKEQRELSLVDLTIDDEVSPDDLFNNNNYQTQQQQKTQEYQMKSSNEIPLAPNLISTESSPSCPPPPTTPIFAQELENNNYATEKRQYPISYPDKKFSPDRQKLFAQNPRSPEPQPQLKAKQPQTDVFFIDAEDEQRNFPFPASTSDMSNITSSFHHQHPARQLNIASSSSHAAAADSTIGSLRKQDISSRFATIQERQQIIPNNNNPIPDDDDTLEEWLVNILKDPEFSDLVSRVDKFWKARFMVDDMLTK